MQNKNTDKFNNRRLGNVSVFILAGGTEVGSCELSGRLPESLWLAGDKPVLERLIDSLLKQGVTDITLCINGENDIFARHLPPEIRDKVRLAGSDLPSGTAGAVRDAAGGSEDGLLVIIPANIMRPPSVRKLIDRHLETGCRMSALFNPPPYPRNGYKTGKPANMYICETSVLGYIPAEGYFDIKESLIPELLRAGEDIASVNLEQSAGNFRGRRQYLAAVGEYLNSFPELDSGLKLQSENDRQSLWSAADAKIASSARIYGKVVVMGSADISENAVIIGPCIIGENSYIGEGSVVVKSAIWNNARIEANCSIRECVVDCGSRVSSSSSAEEKEIVCRKKSPVSESFHKITAAAKTETSKIKGTLENALNKIDGKLPERFKSSHRNWGGWAAAGLVTAAFLWSYWPNLQNLWGIWQRSDEYSVGILVPFLAVYVLWSRRDEISRVPVKPAILSGAAAFIIAQGFRIFGLYFMYGSAMRFSIGVSIAGLVLLLFGWKIFRKAFTVLLFLFLMLPWPNRVEAAIANPLQRWATSSALFCLEVLGYGATREGNIIHIGDTSVAVAEACNGLRMITAFLVICALVALVINKEWWKKFLILASALPIALLCNTVRLAITAIAFTKLDGEQWQSTFHDFGGYAMMPLALLIVVGELWFLDNLVKEPGKPDKPEQVIINRKSAEN